MKFFRPRKISNILAVFRESREEPNFHSLALDLCFRVLGLFCFLFCFFIPFLRCVDFLLCYYRGVRMWCGIRLIMIYFYSFALFFSSLQILSCFFLFSSSRFFFFFSFNLSSYSLGAKAAGNHGRWRPGPHLAPRGKQTTWSTPEATWPNLASTGTWGFSLARSSQSRLPH